MFDASTSANAEYSLLRDIRSYARRTVRHGGRCGCGINGRFISFSVALSSTKTSRREESFCLAKMAQNPGHFISKLQQSVPGPAGPTLQQILGQKVATLPSGIQVSGEGS